ncbi:DUF2339 domain-containing protein [Erythrobacter sp. SD-21]|uniref:DUF2339 domain-containing protein n=1 Tax=Erythrobacter sp. SD-21 TaxID=161528 RepID=UPI000153EFD9|nr:DUF2339 domain-containing protein [Erythrobacter sp. SD-21]EDL47847.1 integral membrane protein [Erythrobacter sp. SD-21]
MLWLLVLGLIVACALLFQRLQRAEERLSHLEERQDEQAWRILALAGTEAASAPQPSEPAPPELDSEPSPQTPAVTLRRLEEPAEVFDPGPPEPEQQPEPSAATGPTVEPATARFRFDFEEIFGRRLPIWAGGITLAVAGVFLVRYSIEQGLLTPTVRVALSFLFGTGLLASAELAYRFEDRVRDERVRQALAGAGLATLYAAFYLAGTQYALIGQTFAFLGLAGVTALAIFLSYRFGLPSAVLGLVGGFAAPALVGGEDANLPMLALYLALVTGGLTQTANRQHRSWLGLGALAGGLGWGALLLLGGDYAFADILALGLYFIVLGTLVPALLEIERLEQPIRLAAAGLAGLQLAVLIDAGGYQPLAWGLYMLLGAALAWFGWRRPDMRAGSTMAAVIGIVLLQLWPSPEPVSFALVAASLAALFAAVPLAQLRWKDGGALEALSVAGVALAIGLVTLWTFETFDRDALRLWEGFGLIALAALPAAAALVLWERKVKGELAANLASASLLAFLASVCLLPDPAMPFAASAIATGLAVLLRERAKDSRSLLALLWMGAIGTFLTLPISDARLTEIETLFEGLGEASILSFLRWLAVALPFAVMAFFGAAGRRRAVAEFLAGLILFAALAQVLSPIVLVWVAAALVVGLCIGLPERSFAALALIACIALWALSPIGEWLSGATMALGSEPMLVTDLPRLREVLGFILPLAIALGTVRVQLPAFSKRGLPLFWMALPPALLVVHTLFKQLFRIDSLPHFADMGLTERTVWQALLLCIGWAVWARLNDRVFATLFAAASLAHFLWFTVLLHNPLWDHQAVGSVPIANLAFAAYAVGIAALLSARRWWPEWRRFTDSVTMVLATLGAMTLLRQGFAGTFLDTLPMSQTEDLLRSFVGILLAVAFLLIGSARGERLWRVGSLVLMTGTVLKVFIVDTAGLEGLLRIASFVALGASLIGIGWFYSRQLKAVPAEQ